MDSSGFARETPIRIGKLRRDGFDLPDDATILDTWKCKQILLRREFGLPDDASYHSLFSHVLSYGESHGARWEERCENLHVPDVGNPPFIDVLRQCQAGETLLLARSPSREDIAPVKLCRTNGDEVGLCPSGFSIAEEIDRGLLFAARLTTISAKIGDSRVYFELQSGEVIGEVIDSQRKPSRKFFSTLMANVDLFCFESPRPNIV